ncbi:MAG: M57 family metalloprotease [Acidobacteriota bacterium]
MRLTYKLRIAPVTRFLLAFTATLAAMPLAATSVVPVSDFSLYERSDLVVHGVVKSSAVIEDFRGMPETVTVIEPLEVVKGGLAGDLVLHQAGGTLPDGRFFKLWGRPEYTPGHEVIVFAISRPEGDFQTSEMLLGKFEVKVDEQGTLFAESSLAGTPLAGVSIHPELRLRSGRTAGEISLDSSSGPRELGKFTTYLRNGALGDELVEGSPKGILKPARRAADPQITPQWTNLGGLWRYNNNATAGWVTEGTANVTGGGAGEAQRALATWTNEQNSSINYTLGGSNPIHLNALSSPCGWSTALPAGLGVIGCGGPNGGGSNSWRGETYSTITGGEVWLRAYSSLNQVSSVVTESVLLHELGHTLGLGHSDQSTSSHDSCPGDEAAATMRSSVQNRTTLGTDDVDAVRWLYGDGGNSCSSSCTKPTISTQPQSQSISSGQSTALSVAAGGASSYQWYIGASGTTSSPVAGGSGASVSVSPSSTTSYWVRITNSCGSTDSSAATVTVTSVSGTSSASPNPMVVCDGSGLGSTTLQWNYPGAGIVEIHLGSPSGPLFSRSGSSGTANTGKWVSNGLKFYAQNVTGGLPLTSANTLGTVTASVSCSANSFTASPDQVNICDGSGLGVTRLGWNFPAAGIVEIRLGSPNGPLFSRSGSAGNATTGKWVANGTVFYAQNVTGGLPLTSAHTLGTVKVHVGCLRATPNPVQQCDGSGLAVANLNWSYANAQIVELHLASPIGPLFSRTGPSASASTGKWVPSGLTFYAQDVSGGLPLTSANTLGTVTVSVTCP